MLKLNFGKIIFLLIFLVPLLLNLALVLCINVKLEGGFINPNDGALLLTINDLNKSFFTLWSENNLGYIYGLFAGINFFPQLYSGVLLRLGASIKLVELTIYFTCLTLVFYTSWYAFYLIQKLVFFHRNILYPYLIAFLYTYNIYVLSLIGVLDQIFLPLLLSPFFLYILIFLLEREANIKIVFFLGLIFALTLNVPIFSFAVFICLLIPFFIFKKNISNVKLFFAGLFALFIGLSISSPLIYALTHAYTFLDPFAANNSVHIDYIFPPFAILGVFQLFFNWTIIYVNTYANLYFRNGFGLISSYMLFSLIIYAVFLSWKSIINKRVLLFLLFALILSMFLSKGVQPPIKELNDFLYRMNPIFAIFRTPGSKFGLPIMLLVSSLLLFILNIVKKSNFTIFVAIVLILQTWVFFNPINFVGEETLWWNKSIVLDSDDYTSLTKFINSSKKTGAVLLYPPLRSGHYDLKNGNKFSFQDVLGKHIERPIIYPDAEIRFTLAKAVLSKLLVNFDPRIAGNLSIRYVLIRRDFDTKFFKGTKEVERAEAKLTSANYKIVFKNELFSVYETSPILYKDLITVKTKSGEYQPLYRKIAPYHYSLNVKKKDIIGNLIVFRNNFYSGWEILDLKKNGLFAKQILVDDFANGWKIEMINKNLNLDTNEDVELNIYYHPQKILYLYSKFAIISGTVLFLTFISINKVIKK